MKRNIIILALLLSNVVLGQESKVDSLDQFIMNQAKKFHIPGIAACVIKNDKIIWSNSYGYRDIENEKKMATTSIMNIASISKTITATAIMQLWEKSKLNLNTDINTYLDFTIRNPNHPNIPITIKQLLTHSSSIADGSSLKTGFECGEPTRSLKNWLSNYFSKKGEFYNEDENFHKAKPDSLHQYSNIGFGVLGLIVEEVSGIAFHEYVQKNIFEPLEMTNSGYFLNQVDSTQIVTPYLYLGPLQKVVNKKDKIKILPYFNPYCNYSFWNYPDGLVRTSVEDLSKFAIAYMNEGNYKSQKILKKETIDLMMSPQLNEAVNEDKDQGLSWFQSPSLYPSWFHGGSDPGVSTRMYVNKVDKITVIVFQNANEDNSYYIIKKLYDAFK
ncbi:serine hydrolase domain-containing protein [Winogradskyella flava]|uniref:serine hydrolase domain-containing protein n=1 Tax=Winogradskyella flava TaxID=1884876 RepID=UPI00248F497A|nr:serine hydrolase domain-containing protein [Winogradskyella flava]